VLKYKLGGFLLFRLRKFGKPTEQILKELCGSLKNGGTFLDIGANVGLITKLVLDTTPENVNIKSLEPDPIAFESLRKNIFDKRVELINAAAWSSSTQLPLFRNVSSKGNVATTSSSLDFSKTNVDVNEFEMVRTIDICKLIDEVQSSPIILKIDVEGAEYKIINHMIKKGCIRKIEKIYCEFHFNSIRFGYSKHIYLFTKLFLTGNAKRIKAWF
jgi:FkbM family methyltransferase